MDPERPTPSRPKELKTLHEFSSSVSIWSENVHEELLQHSRYIRDYLAPVLATQPALPAAELALLSSIMTRIGAVPMTIDLLRHSRIEKALMLIIFEAEECWPTEIVFRAERILKKWETDLGDGVPNVLQDFFGSGGRLEGLKGYELAVGERDFGLADRVWWATRQVHNLRPFQIGHAGFEVGSWFLNPTAAHHAGIIANPTIPITSHPLLPPTTLSPATALLLTHDAEELLPPTNKGTHLRYHHASTPSTPPPIPLCHTLASTTNKQIRILRSYKLASPFAPSAGVRYDGLYVVKGYSVKLQGGNAWRWSFELERSTGTQPPLSSILQTPTSDQLDDWRDYLRFLVANYGTDAAGPALAELGVGGSGELATMTTTMPVGGVALDGGGRRDSGYESVEGEG